MVLGASIGLGVLGTGLQIAGARKTARAQERAVGARAAVARDLGDQQNRITQHMAGILQQLAAERGQGLGDLVSQMTGGRSEFLQQAQGEQQAGIQDAIGQVVGPEPAMAQGPAASFDVVARQASQERLDPQLALMALTGARSQLGSFEQQAGQQFALSDMNRGRTAQEAFAGSELGRALLGEQMVGADVQFQQDMQGAQKAGGGLALAGALLQGAGTSLTGIRRG